MSALAYTIVLLFLVLQDKDENETCELECRKKYLFVAFVVNIFYIEKL